MSYELKEYLNSINYTKVNIMDSGDEMYEKKYSSFLVNKCLAPHNDTILLVNEVNRYHNICLLYTSPSPRDVEESRMPSSA